jgi:hypothetical protein
MNKVKNALQIAAGVVQILVAALVFVAVVYLIILVASFASIDPSNFGVFAAFYVIALVGVWLIILVIPIILFVGVWFLTIGLFLVKNPKKPWVRTSKTVASVLAVLSNILPLIFCLTSGSVSPFFAFIPGSIIAFCFVSLFLKHKKAPIAPPPPPQCPQYPYPHYPYYPSYPPHPTYPPYPPYPPNNYPPRH